MICTKMKFNGFLVIGFAWGILAASSQAFAGDNYEMISTGMTVEQVENLIGAPSDMDKDFTKPTLNYIASTLKGLDNKDSDLFLLWKIREDLIYVIGLNKDEKVAVKHRFFFATKP